MQESVDRLASLLSAARAWALLRRRKIGKCSEQRYVLFGVLVGVDGCP